jgi:hypothetical protein
MRPAVAVGVALLLFAASARAVADTDEKVVDIPARPGTTQRFLWLEPPNARAAVILFAGGCASAPTGRSAGAAATSSCARGSFSPSGDWRPR